MASRCTVHGQGWRQWGLWALIVVACGPLCCSLGLTGLCWGGVWSGLVLGFLVLICFTGRRLLTLCFCVLASVGPPGPPWMTQPHLSSHPGPLTPVWTVAPLCRGHPAFPVMACEDLWVPDPLPKGHGRLGDPNSGLFLQHLYWRSHPHVCMEVTLPVFLWVSPPPPLDFGLSRKLRHL